MNLRPIEPVTDTHLICCRCDAWIPCASTLVDLDGKPFRAYYCAPCANTIQDSTP